MTRCPSRLYFQTAADPEGHNGQFIGTFEQGELAVDSLAVFMESFTVFPFLHHVLAMSTVCEAFAPLPLLRNTTQEFPPEQQNPQGDWRVSTSRLNNTCCAICLTSFLGDFTVSARLGQRLYQCCVAIDPLGAELSSHIKHTSSLIDRYVRLALNKYESKIITC